MVLESLGVKPSALVTVLQKTIGIGQEPYHPRNDLPFSAEAKNVLALSMDEARDLSHSNVGTQHLLLGLVREDAGLAANTLRHAGLGLDQARRRATEIAASAKHDDDNDRHRADTDASRARLRAERSGHGSMVVVTVPVPLPQSAQFAASLIEAMARDPHVAAVFAAQGIDVSKLSAALRAPPTA